MRRVLLPGLWTGFQIGQINETSSPPGWARPAVFHPYASPVLLQLLGQPWELMCMGPVPGATCPVVLESQRS
jgi:hypothetical protein